MVTDPAGRVAVVYKPATGAKVYHAGAKNLTPTGDAPLDVEIEEAPPVPAKGSGVVPADAIHVWTDGGCVPNPGPAGIGVVVIDGVKKDRRELSEYLGHGTNNIAELTAIVRGLEVAREIGKDRTVVVYSDSQYAIGLLTQNWKAKVNVELVAELRGLLKQFSEVRFVKVAAHTGIALNERVDELATAAIQRGV
ncbi:MAG: ribonuclease H [Kofleriaceae bacterium]